MQWVRYHIAGLYRGYYCIFNNSIPPAYFFLPHFLQLKNKGVRDLIIKTVEGLPEKQKLVLSLYYYEDLNLKEIGRILDVTESRVSQLHTQAVQKMKLKLKNLLQE